MNKHTPGPWSFHKERQRDTEASAVFVIRASGDDFLASIAHTTRTKHPRIEEANARLIAAAPELLEALEYLLEQTVDQDLRYGITLTEGEKEAMQKALAVISKAKAT